MTDENRRRHIAAELAKADDALRAAEALLKLDLCDDAVTRFYYAALHFAAAALLTEGVEATSHRGMVTLLSAHLVRTGKLAPTFARHLKRLQGYREAADYDRHFRFDRAGAEEEAAVARVFADGIRELLRGGGWL